MIKNKLILKITITVVILGLLCFLWCCKIHNDNFHKKENDLNDSYSDRSSDFETGSNNFNEDIENITIYDIEEGFLSVPYNKTAKKNSYNFDKYLKRENGYYKYEDDNYISKLGIDVSSYQGTIDWKKVEDSGIEFAFLRLGYRGYGDKGNILLDTKFEENYKKAKEEGLDIGIYFFSQAISVEEAREEAKFVLKNIQGKEIKYPVMFDLEKIKSDSARTDNLTSDEMTSFFLEFCKTIEESGYKAGIYGNAKTFTTKLKIELFDNYYKWYADYQEKPLYPYDFSVYQYSESGKVNGITGNVDMDICFVKK